MNKKIEYIKTIGYFIFILIILGIIGVMKTFMKSLNLLIDIINITETSLEFKFLLILLTLWINLEIIKVVINVLLRIKENLDRKIEKV